MYVAPITSKEEMEAFLTGAVHDYSMVLMSRDNADYIHDMKTVTDFGVWLVDTFWYYPNHGKGKDNE